jgi:hypothetical protein
MISFSGAGWPTWGQAAVRLRERASRNQASEAACGTGGAAVLPGRPVRT